MVFTCIKLSLVWSKFNQKRLFSLVCRAANTAESSKRREISFHSLPSSPYFRAMFIKRCDASKSQTPFDRASFQASRWNNRFGTLIPNSFDGWPQERGSAVIADPYFCQLFLWHPDEYLSFNHIRVGRADTGRAGRVQCYSQIIVVPLAKYTYTL